MSSIRLAVLVSSLALMCSACSLVGGTQESPATNAAAAGVKPDAKAESKADDTAAKQKSAERKLAVTKARLGVAELEIAGFETDLANKLAAAEAELALSQQKLDQFDKVDQPARIAQGELSLLRGRDRAAEADDELKQIEIMYKDQDLNDMTAEFVVSRGKRNADRTNAQIKLDQSAFDTMKSLELPRERRRLELDAIAKKNALESAKRDGEIQRKNKQIAVQNLENEITGIEEEMAKLAAPKP